MPKDKKETCVMCGVVSEKAPSRRETKKPRRQDVTERRKNNRDRRRPAKYVTS